MSRTRFAVLISLVAITLSLPIAGKDWHWVEDQSLSLPSLVQDGASLSLAGPGETFFLVLNGRLFRCSRSPGEAGSCMVAESLGTPTAEGGALLLEREGSALTTGYRGLPATELPRNPDKKRKRWDMMFPLLAATSHEISSASPTAIDFRVSATETLALKVDAYGAPDTRLTIKLEPQAGGSGVFATEMELGAGGMSTLSERVQLPQGVPAGEDAWRLILSRSAEAQDGVTQTNAPLVAEVWIMSIGLQEHPE